MKRLSNSEYEILELFFERDCQIASNEIYDLIENLFSIEWSRQSGSVYLDRMMKKGVIRRERVEGKNQYLSVSKDEYDDFLVEDLVKNRSFKSMEAMLINFFPKDAENVDKALEEIQTVIKKHLKNS